MYISLNYPVDSLESKESREHKLFTDLIPHL